MLRRSSAFVVAVLAACAPPPMSAPIVVSPPSASATVEPIVSAPPSPSAPDPFGIPEIEADAPIAEEPETFSAFALPTTSTTAPASCAAWTKRALVPVPACDTREAARTALDWALDGRLGDESIDGRLASIEACAGLDAGFVRALRVARAPIVCADVLAAPLFEHPPVGLRGPIFHALSGHAIAAKAARIAEPKASAKAAEKTKSDHARADTLGKLEAAAATLPRSYGRAVALAGIAAAWTHLATIDERADHASRAAIEAMAASGIGDAAIIGRARDALMIPFGWLAEIDALRLPDFQVGPRVAPPSPPLVDGQPPPRDGWDDRRRALSVIERFAEDLPSFFAALLFDDAEIASLDAVRGFARRGTLPLRARVALAHGEPSNEVTRAAGRARLALALRFFDRREADGALRLFAASPPTDRPRLLVALALVLHAGPRDLAEWTAAPLLADRFDTRALDLVANGPLDETTTLATYDAGIFHELEGGPVAGDLASITATLQRYDAVIAGGKGSVNLLRERAEAIRRLLREIKNDGVADYDPATPIRFEGWPHVRTDEGTWTAPSGGMTSIFTANRTGSVNRALRRRSYRFEKCFEREPTPTTLAIRFVIGRDGSVSTATASESSLLGACVTNVIERIGYSQPDFGPWTVDVTFRFARP